MGHGDSETRGRGTWDVGTRGRDKQTTPHFCDEFVKYNFRCSRAKCFTFFSVRERAEFNKSCNLIGSWSERNFLISITLEGGIHFRERINGYRQSFALSTLP